MNEPIREITGGPAMLSFWSDEIVGVRTARSLMTPTEMISLKDMVFAPSLSQLFVPCAFLEVIFMTGTKEFIVQANCHSWKTGCLLEALPEKSLLLWELDFRPVAYTYRSCGSIHACLQTIDQDCLRRRPDMIRFQRTRLGSVCEKESKWDVFFSVGVQGLT